MYYHQVLLLLGFITVCSCELIRSGNYELYDFINYYNLPPDRPHEASGEYLRAVEEIDSIDERTARMAANERAEGVASLGGEKTQNPNDPVYIKLAEESMQKYLTSNCIPQTHRVIQINNVTTQIVSGSLTRINFVVASSEDANANRYNCFSKIWQQPWLNKKDINVTCTEFNERAKRDLLIGGETPQNLNDPVYIKLAEESMQKYLQSNSILQSHRVIQIKNVTTQVVSGSLTRISFVVASSEDANTNRYDCFSKIWEQPWLNKKDINVTCTEFNERAKRDILPDGETLKNPNNPVYIKLAEESMQKYLQSNSILQPHRVIQIKKVTTQVVSGTLTRISFVVSPSEDVNGNVHDCISKIWEQPWLNKKDINVNCTEVNKRPKRDTKVGDETPQNPNDPKYIKLAEESMQKYLKSKSILQPHRVIQIKNVTTQVVSGSLTRISFVVSPSEDINANGYNCFSTILVQSWLNNKDIDVNCTEDNQSAKRNTL